MPDNIYRSRITREIRKHQAKTIAGDNLRNACSVAGNWQNSAGAELQSIKRGEDFALRRIGQLS